MFRIQLTKPNSVILVTTSGSQQANLSLLGEKPVHEVRNSQVPKLTNDPSVFTDSPRPEGKYDGTTP
jgi:hypothetical protein